MKSPFPGMDPFLERHWQDIHSTFMVYAKQQLNQQLPQQLLARVEESLAVETDDGRFRLIYPDISVVEQQAIAVGLLAESTESAAVAVADPFEVPLPLQAPQHRHSPASTRSGCRVEIATHHRRLLPRRAIPHDRLQATAKSATDCRRIDLDRIAATYRSGRIVLQRSC